MHVAAGYGHAGAVSALVRLGADLDARPRDGYTALMGAALHGKVECARALLAGGADRTLRATGGYKSVWGGGKITSRYEEGKTALEIAEAGDDWDREEVKRGKAEVAALLRE